MPLARGRFRSQAEVTRKARGRRRHSVPRSPVAVHAAGSLSPNDERNGWPEIVRGIQRRVSQIERARTFRSVCSIAIGGSVGRGEADASSDVDVFIVVEKPLSPKRVLMLVDSLGKFVGEPIVSRGPTYVPGFGFSCSRILQGGDLIQWNVSVRGAEGGPMAGLRRMVLLERGRRLRERAGEPNEVTEALRQADVNSCSLFWLRAVNAVQALERGHLWLTLRWLAEMRESLLVMIRWEQRSPPPGLVLSLPSKAFEANCGVRAARSLAFTQPAYDHRAASEAIVLTVRRFLKLMRRRRSPGGVQQEDLRAWSTLARHLVVRVQNCRATWSPPTRERD